jgi:hypothetical protein
MDAAGQPGATKHAPGLTLCFRTEDRREQTFRIANSGDAFGEAPVIDR